MTHPPNGPGLAEQAEIVASIFYLRGTTNKAGGCLFAVRLCLTGAAKRGVLQFRTRIQTAGRNAALLMLSVGS